MKKTTAYARKMRAHGKTIGIVNSAAWVNAIERCQPMCETDPIVQGIERHTDPYARLIEAREALISLQQHKVPAEDPAPYNILACITDVTWLRSLQIDRNPETNPMYDHLHAARAALHDIRTRWVRMGRWGMSGPERKSMQTAVDHYEAMLLASSPEQMIAAEDERMRQIKAGNFFAPRDATEGAA